MGRGEVVELLALPLDHLAMRLKAAVGDDGDGVLTFVSGGGVFKALVHVAGNYFAGGLGPIAGAGDLVFPHVVGQHFIVHLNGARGIASGRLTGGGDVSDFRARPLDFGAGFGDDANALHAGHLLGGRGVDGADDGVRVRRTEEHGVQESVGHQVRRVLCFTARFFYAVQA